LHLIVRPLLSFIVLAALVFALLQGTGRVVFALLDRLETVVNQVLGARDITVAGLQGSWRGFNPIVRIARVDLPAGRFENLYVEPDLLRSLFDGRLVLYRGKVGAAELALEPTPAGGWRLRGMPAGNGFDPIALLTGTDQLEFRGSLAFVRDPIAPFRLDVEYAASNRSGMGRHRLLLRNGADDCAAPCELRLDVRRQEDRWFPVQDARSALSASATNFVIGSALARFATVQLDALEVDWRGSEESSLGRGLLFASGTRTADGRPFVARANAVSGGREGRHWGEISKLEITQDDKRLDVPPIAVDLDDDVLHATVGSLPVAELARLLKSALAGNEVASRWLNALALDAQVSDLHAFYRIPTREVGYALTLDDFNINGYKGVPTIRQGSGSLRGFTTLGTGRPQFDVGHAIRIDFDTRDMGVAFPDQLHANWRLPYARGQLLAWFRRDEFRMRGLDMAAQIGASAITGSVGIARVGKDERDRRVAALGRFDRMTVAEGRDFVPFTLQPRTYEWLTATPAEGIMTNGSVAYQGWFRVPPGVPGRRLEIAGDVADGRIRYHPDWPEVEAFAGPLEIAGREVRATAHAATSLGADLAGTRLRLTDNAAVAEVEFAAHLDAGQALGYVHRSPLRTALPFIGPAWTGSGPVIMTGELTVPVKEFGRLKDSAGERGPEAAPRGVPEGFAVDLAVELGGVALGMPEYRLDFAGLTGPVAYVFPSRLTSKGITGTLFEAPARIDVTSGDQRFRLAVAGTARDGDFWRVIDVSDPGLTEGSAKFDALLDVAAPTRSGSRDPAAPPPALTVTSDLAGLAARLPGNYGKSAEEAAPVEARLVMPGTQRMLTFSYRDAIGWLRLGDRLEQGAIGLGVAPEDLPPAMREVVITGEIDRLGLADLTLGGGSGMLPIPVRLEQLAVDRLQLGSVGIADARLDARFHAGQFTASIESADLIGTARRPVALDNAAPPAVAAEPVPIEIDIEELHLPKASGSGDPLSPDVIADIPPLDVSIHELTVGDADYGHWKFRLRAENGDLWFRDLDARIRKVDIRSETGVVWRGATNETTFDGQLEMANLADVLPLWGYAPNVESERATLTGAMTWPGSPASFDLLKLTGVVNAWARNGRFLEVESGGGAQRIVSLLNFTTVAKRISLDFSDVVGKGLSFDKLKATFALDNGALELLKPLDVEGTGLKFKMTGTVSLADRVLDNEMVVTLPVSRGLPWYAAYVALANPIAGLGVLVGERMLRKPLEQFSSARYRITGTVEEPEVKLVSVFATGETEDRQVEVPVDPAAAPAAGATAAPASEAASTDVRARTEQRARTKLRARTKPGESATAREPIQSAGNQ
jgi:uncharacterized protein YhdP